MKSFSWLPSSSTPKPKHLKVKAKWPKGTYISLFYRKSKYDTVGNKSIYKFMNEAKAELFFFIDNNFKIWDMSYLLHYETFYSKYMRKKWKQHVINSCVRIAFLIMNLNVPSHNDVLLLLVSRSKRFAFFYVDLDVQCRLLNWFNI